jgi:hypothetical protein
MSVGWWMPHYEEVKDVSVGWWMPHYEEGKDVSRMVDATLQRS